MRTNNKAMKNYWNIGNNYYGVKSAYRALRQVEQLKSTDALVTIQAL